MPLVSVCIPVYNTQDYIQSAVKSVLDQSYQDYELFVIDNKSTDSTVDRVEEIGDTRINLIVNERNIGAKNNFNKCLDQTSGEYIKILCADDTLYPRHIERHVSFFETHKNEDLALVCSARHIMLKNNRCLFSKGFPGKDDTIIEGQTAIMKTLRSGSNLIGEPSCTTFRRSFLDAAGRFDDTFPYVIDMYFWFRLLRAGKLGVIKEPLSGFRIFSDSWSASVGAQQGTQTYDFIRFYCDKYNLHFTPLQWKRLRLRCYVAGFMRNMVFRVASLV